MNRQQMRASKAHGRRLMKGGWSPFVEISRTDTSGTSAPWPRGCDTMWKNHLYIVMRYPHNTEWGPVDRLLVRRNDGAPVHAWADLQRIKNELLDPERTAVEVYPPASELVDDAHCYHLWVLPMGFLLPFTLGQAPPSEWPKGAT